jgi:hypothetical protein
LGKLCRTQRTIIQQFFKFSLIRAFFFDNCLHLCCKPEVATQQRSFATGIATSINRLLIYSIVLDVGAPALRTVGPFRGSCGRVAPLRSTSWFAIRSVLRTAAGAAPSRHLARYASTWFPHIAAVGVPANGKHKMAKKLGKPPSQGKPLHRPSDVEGGQRPYRRGVATRFERSEPET